MRLERLLMEASLLALTKADAKKGMETFLSTVKNTGASDWQSFLTGIDFRKYLPTGLRDSSSLTIFDEYPDIAPVTYNGDKSSFGSRDEAIDKLISFAPKEFQSRALSYGLSLLEATFKNDIPANIFNARYDNWLDLEAKHGSASTGLLSLAKSIATCSNFFTIYKDDLDARRVSFTIHKDTPNVLGFSVPIPDGVSTDDEAYKEAVRQSSAYSLS